ncbi:MAG: ATP-binding cassette domain-containing protein, partial [Planctomycetota bacterium]
MAIVELRSLSKEYHMGPVVVPALLDVDLQFDSGDFVAITGPSGSGKSTLLNLLGLLDQPTAGEYLLDGTEVGSLSDDQRSEVRSRRISFIFQSYNLIPQLSVIENIEIPLYYQGWHASKSHRRASELAQLVGLSDRIHHRPTELSGG